MRDRGYRRVLRANRLMNENGITDILKVIKKTPELAEVLKVVEGLPTVEHGLYGCKDYVDKDELIKKLTEMWEGKNADIKSVNP